tara:strand:+ start:277 stop:441 length:165 start_codon:yes stop_codon:yes gene_type:complete
MKNVLNLGTPLTKEAQKSVMGGTYQPPVDCVPTGEIGWTAPGEGLGGQPYLICE